MMIFNAKFTYCSYHTLLFVVHQVKFSELTLDTFRMMQNLEWEPSGSFYQANLAPSIGPGSGANQNGASGPSRVNQDMTDPTLPPNPRKAILFRPSVTHFMAVSILHLEVLLTFSFSMPPQSCIKLDLIYNEQQVELEQ